MRSRPTATSCTCIYLSSVTDVQETSSGLKGVPAVADAKPGKIYVNANDGQRYRFNGKTNKYDKVDKSDKDLETLRVRKLADIKKYLKKQGGVYSGDNKKVIKDFEGDKKDLDPNGLYKKGGTEANPTYEIIDLEKRQDISDTTLKAVSSMKWVKTTVASFD